MASSVLCVGWKIKKSLSTFVLVFEYGGRIGAVVESAVGATLEKLDFPKKRNSRLTECFWRWPEAPIRPGKDVWAGYCLMFNPELPESRLEPGIEKTSIVVPSDRRVESASRPSLPLSRNDPMSFSKTVSFSRSSLSAFPPRGAAGRFHSTEIFARSFRIPALPVTGLTQKAEGRSAT